MRTSLVVVAALAGCNQILGLTSTNLVDADMRPDLDKDGIADIDDECIASPVDAVEDFDRDHVPNAIDGCPSVRQTRGDLDGDTIPDDCDPNPLVPGDHMRCVMRFLNAELNESLWAPRVGEGQLGPSAGYLDVGPGQSGIATGPVLPDAPSITIDLIAFIDTMYPDFTFTVFLRGGPTPSPTDVACELRGTTMEITLALTGAVSAVATPGPVMSTAGGGAFAIQLRMQPTQAGNNVMCAAGYDTTTMLIERHIDFPPGNFGFAVPRGEIYIYSLVIYDRDNVQAFPF